MLNRKSSTKLETVKELIYWSYANLAMAHAALEKELPKYNRLSFMIRSRIYKGLISGNMNIGSMFDDEKIKIKFSDICAYCGSNDNISIDHIIPRYKGGDNCADNLIRVCKHCNSSKGKKDMIEWFYSKNEFPPILILRRYLKLVYAYCIENNLLDCKIDSIDKTLLPFNLDYIPTNFPQPNDIVLYKK